MQRPKTDRVLAVPALPVLGGLPAFGAIGTFLGPPLLAADYRLAIDWTASAIAAEA